MWACGWISRPTRRMGTQPGRRPGAAELPGTGRVSQSRTEIVSPVLILTSATSPIATSSPVRGLRTRIRWHAQDMRTCKPMKYPREPRAGDARQELPPIGPHAWHHRINDAPIPVGLYFFIAIPPSVSKRCHSRDTKCRVNSECERWRVA